LTADCGMDLASQNDWQQLSLNMTGGSDSVR